MTRLLGGAKGPYRDIVLLNAAPAFIVAGLANDLRSGVARAAASIDDGAAHTALSNMIAVTRPRA
jgi:anthranilate phosphoribosyltransferase